jgi:hypothetical protein
MVPYPQSSGQAHIPGYDPGPRGDTTMPDTTTTTPDVYLLDQAQDGGAGGGL